MNNNFDTQWERRYRALANSHNPLCDDRWQALVDNAVLSSAQSEGSVPQVKGPDKRNARRIWSAGIAAACAALIIFGIGHRNMQSQPQSVDYSGQSVRFICNNQCSAQSTIAYFDSYIGKKANL